MATKFFSERNLRFLLDEIFDVASLTQYDTYKEYDGRMFEMVLKAAVELAEGLLWPFRNLHPSPPGRRGRASPPAGSRRASPEETASPPRPGPRP
jgi:hypothetical protein